MTRPERNALLRLLAGFTIWSAGFVALYALQALGCAYGWGAWHRPMLIGGYLLSLLPLAWLSLQRGEATGEPATTLSVAALWANRAALGAGVLVYLPVTFATVCI